MSNSFFAGLGNALVAAIKISVVLGVASLGYFFGAWEKDRLLLAAEDIAYSKGKQDANAELLQLHRAELENASRMAREEGYRLGVVEQSALNNSLESQGVLIARLLSIVNAPPSQSSLSVETRSALREVAEAVDKGDYVRASQLLPQEVVYAAESVCTEANGLYIVSAEQRFNICRSGEVIIVTEIKKRSLHLSVDGKRVTVWFATREKFSESCFIAYERRSGTNETPSAEVRLGCS